MDEARSYRCDILNRLRAFDLPRGATLADREHDVLSRQIVTANTAVLTPEHVYDAHSRYVAKVTADTTVTHHLYDIEYCVLEEMREKQLVR